MLSALIARHY